jgi:nitroreductase
LNLSALLRKRRNVYGFESRAIPDKVLMTILEDARHVPSAGFTQDFEFIVVKDPMIRKELATAGHQAEYMSEGLAKSDFISSAPVIVVPCGNTKRFEEKYGRAEQNARLPWWLIDAGFASFALILSAFEHGLAASFLGALDDEKVRQILNIPMDGSMIPLALVPIGYKDPAEEVLWKKRSRKAVPNRRGLADLVHWNKW